MRRVILADTGPLYALTDSSDQFHARARRELKRLRREEFSIAVTYPVLMETYTLILRRLGLKVARSWLEEVLAGAGQVNPTPRDYHEAIRWTLGYPDQPLTLFDTVLAVLSERLALPVWTFDHHFELMRVALWR